LIDDLAKQIIAERLTALGEWIYRLRQR